jgi:hypothetical protein
MLGMLRLYCLTINYLDLRSASRPGLKLLRGELELPAFLWIRLEERARLLDMSRDQKHKDGLDHHRQLGISCIPLTEYYTNLPGTLYCIPRDVAQQYLPTGIDFTATRRIAETEKPKGEGNRMWKEF